MSEVTLMGLYCYDNTLFDKVTLPSLINKDTLVETILLEYGDRQVIYANADFMREALSIWCKKHNKTFTEWAEVLEIDFSPLENYDRIEDIKDVATSSSDNETFTNTYEDDTYHASNKANSNTNGANTRTARIHGNVGVTTSQQMLQSHLNLYKNFNLYMEIAKLFADDFIIGIY